MGAAERFRRDRQELASSSPAASVNAPQWHGRKIGLHKGLMKARRRIHKVLEVLTVYNSIGILGSDCTMVFKPGRAFPKTEGALRVHAVYWYCRYAYHGSHEGRQLSCLLLLLRIRVRQWGPRCCFVVWCFPPKVMHLPSDDGVGPEKEVALLLRRVTSELVVHYTQYGPSSRYYGGKKVSACPLGLVYASQSRPFENQASCQLRQFMPNNRGQPSLERFETGGYYCCRLPWRRLGTRKHQDQITALFPVLDGAIATSLLLTSNNHPAISYLCELRSDITHSIPLALGWPPLPSPTRQSNASSGNQKRKSLWCNVGLARLLSLFSDIAPCCRSSSRSSNQCHCHGGPRLDIGGRAACVCRTWRSPHPTEYR